MISNTFTPIWGLCCPNLSKVSGRWPPSCPWSCCTSSVEAQIMRRKRGTVMLSLTILHHLHLLCYHHLLLHSQLHLLLLFLLLHLLLVLCHPWLQLIRLWSKRRTLTTEGCPSSGCIRTSETHATLLLSVIIQGYTDCVYGTRRIS